MQNTAKISHYMSRADIAFCGGGNTVIELTSLGIPSIVIAQNEREELRLKKFRKMGHIVLSGVTCESFDSIANNFIKLVNGQKLRKSIRERLLSFNLKSGRERIYYLIKKVLGDAQHK